MIVQYIVYISKRNMIYKLRSFRPYCMSVYVEIQLNGGWFSTGKKNSIQFSTITIDFFYLARTYTCM